MRGYPPPVLPQVLSPLPSPCLSSGLDFTLCTQVRSEHLAWPVESHVTHHLSQVCGHGGERDMSAAESRVGQCGRCFWGQGVLVLAMRNHIEVETPVLGLSQFGEVQKVLSPLYSGFLF